MVLDDTDDTVRLQVFTIVQNIITIFIFNMYRTHQ